VAVVAEGEAVVDECAFLVMVVSVFSVSVA
jgi:hypothetical protein